MLWYNYWFLCSKYFEMKARKIWANVSVKNARLTSEFYTQLGLRVNQPNSNPKLASFIFGDNEFVIHFFEQNSQIDEYLTYDSKNGNEIIFTLSAETEQEVKEWEDKVQKAGGNIFHELSRDKTGHYGFAFADPDGHKFNVLLMEEGM
jgi:predicted lactoylglutathione lyase